jgi:uncharacterized protein YodC (DUF2158 family)
VKVGDLVRFKYDGQLMLITHEQREGVFNGVFVAGIDNGKSVTSSENLMEKVSESR